MATNTAVYALYQNHRGIDDAVKALRESGFRKGEISVLFPSNFGSRDFTTEESTRAEMIAAGLGSGALICGALGWMAGMGLLTIPGTGPFIAAGPMVALLVGVGVGGGVGSLVGAWIGLRVSRYRAKRSESRIRESNILISVRCGSAEWVNRAKDLLRQIGAEQITSVGEPKADFIVKDSLRPRLYEEHRQTRVRALLARAASPSWRTSTWRKGINNE